MQLEQRISQLKDQSPLVRLEAIAALSKSGNGAQGPMLELLSDMSLPPYSRAGAAKVLGAIGDGSCRLQLERALSEDDIVVRIPAAMALARLKSHDSLPALLRALDHESQIMRKYAEDAAVSVIRSCKAPEKLETLKGYVGQKADEAGPSKALSRLSREIRIAARKLMAADVSGLSVPAAKPAAAIIPAHSKVC